MRGFTVPLLIAEQLIASAAAPIYNRGTLPIGALIGAAFVTRIGIVPTLVSAAFMYLSAVAWLLHPDVRAIGRSGT